MSRSLKMIGNAIWTRLSGDRPGFLKALLIAFIASVAAAVLTFKLLRSE